MPTSPRKRGGGKTASSDVMNNDKTNLPNDGIALMHAEGRVLIAHRFKDDGPEIVLPGLDWQMPQGGIDPNEEPRPAAEREVYGETGVTRIAYLGEMPGCGTYDFPAYVGPPDHRLATFPGQRQ